MKVKILILFSPKIISCKEKRKCDKRYTLVFFKRVIIKDIFFLLIHNKIKMTLNMNSNVTELIYIHTHTHTHTHTHIYI